MMAAQFRGGQSASVNTWLERLAIPPAAQRLDAPVNKPRNPDEGQGPSVTPGRAGNGVSSCRAPGSCPNIHLAPRLPTPFPLLLPASTKPLRPRQLWTDSPSVRLATRTLGLALPLRRLPPWPMRLHPRDTGGP